jgi:putative intracellular protease/amidase
MDRLEIEARVDALRARYEERDEFVAAVGDFAQTLDEADRELLGRVLLARQPDTGGFDVLNERLERGGWFQRTMRKIEQREP